MANDKQQASTGGAVTNSFNKGMLKDYNETFIGEGFYTHARNAVNNSHDGQVGVIGNEPANLHCVTLPYTFIGAIHLLEDEWAVFTTNDTDSEIGIFDESACTYTKVVNDPCLGFKRSHLISGTFRKRYDCERIIYWADGLNPDRTMDLDKVPFIYTEKLVNGCIQKTYTDRLDCEKIRIASLITHPCITLSKGNIAGTLPNGSYQACIAYTVNNVRVSDYIALSEVQSLFTYENVSSSLIVDIVDIDKDFNEFELVLVTNINGQGVAKRIGYYSTAQGRIYVDRWDPEYVTVPIQDVVQVSQPIEKSDAMYVVNNYLLRVGVYSKYQFNYQPQANKIVTKWAAVEYPADYYIKGGNNTGYLRDEQYAFFIRWIYNTGDRSDSYHIPGRSPNATDLDTVTGPDVFETAYGVERQRWQVENTATIDSTVTQVVGDGGVVIATGRMGYWESTELYPADRPDIWGKLCGKPIRHHKMPDVTVDPILNHFNTGGTKIVMLGVYFEGITHPLDQNGKPIENIIGYEILRGSREGNKSIVAKGLFNNLREYTIPGNTDVKGLYQNYPYNDLRADSYLTPVEQKGDNGNKKDKPNSPKLTGYKKDSFSFHSPETSFSNPFLNANEVKIYQEVYGTARGRFEVPFLHPKFRLITNSLDTALDTLATAIGVIQTAATVIGGYTTTLQSDPDLPPIVVGVEALPGVGPFGSISQGLQIAAGVANATFQAAYLALFGAKVNKQQILSMVLALIPFRQFAAQYNSHGLYTESILSVPGNRRREITEAIYAGSATQQFTGDYQINNINRSKYVALQLGSDIADPVTIDNSRTTIGESGKSMYQSFTTTISSHYGAIKLSIPSQYGQLESIKQLPISNCISYTQPVAVKKFNSPIYFNGDTYINRFTEKNSMLFFTTWLMEEPDGYIFDYTLYPTLPYPRYWVNSVRDIGLFADKASEHRSLDKAKKGNFFYMDSGYFYLFNSGVRDFFVESEVNVAYRDWEDTADKRHYDPYRYTDLTSMFRSDMITHGNYYKYDYSLSVAKLFNSQITWGNLLPRDYDPLVASTCYQYRPNRVIYSLPQQDESKKDSWRVFLANNYKDFNNRVTSIKPINKTGALFMMAHQGPLQFVGIEELKLDGTGTKVTIGDGALFSGAQQLQSVVNADASYEYGSNQNRFSSVGTSKGVFWVSQNQGKVFQYASGLKEISNSGLKWWFAKYLPSQLLKAFPNYPLYDNPVKGVGVHTIYDNINEVLYICKKDYKPKVADLSYDAEGNFFYMNNAQVELTDPDYFEDACWTVSYDTKSGTWTSYHDWIPSFLLPGKGHFMSVKDDGIWKHNQRCDLFCNFYGVDYPFEVEFVASTGQQVTTVRSIEYLLEGYKYFNDCRDKYHVLNANFDKAMVYNSEQISGLLNLYLSDRTNPLEGLTYPKINFDSIDINFSKVEQKYRFNQFWDITNKRGQDTPTNIPIILTEANGYKYVVNPTYVNYSKEDLDRKKFRHNINRVWMSKSVSGDTKLLFKLSNEKILGSPR